MSAEIKFMPTDFVPPSPKHWNSRAAIVEQLKLKPGVWAAVLETDKHTQMAFELRRKYPGTETVQRRIKGVTTVYARWVGP